ncbi:hypothetical protein ACTHAL_004168 [Priestia flexa]|nr:hypothetical protein [Priestia flexa]
MNQPIRKLTIKDLKPAAKLFAHVFNRNLGMNHGRFKALISG